MSWYDLAKFSFAQPWWLLWLLVPAVVAFRRGRIGGAPAVTYSSTDILQKLGKPRAERAGAFANALLSLALAAGIIALARPQISNSFTQVQASGIDIMIALDVSASMLTEDFFINGNAPAVSTPSRRSPSASSTPGPTTASGCSPSRASPSWSVRRRSTTAG